MDSVLTAIAVYVLLRLAMTLTGRRNLGQMTAFELVLFIVIGGAVQRALIGGDPSLTNAVIIVATLIGADILFSLIAQRSRLFKRVMTGLPLIVVENGRPLARRMYRARLSEDDVLAAARRHHGLTQIEDVKYAILETNGEISIIPERHTTTPRSSKPDAKLEKMRP